MGFKGISGDSKGHLSPLRRGVYVRVCVDSSSGTGDPFVVTCPHILNADIYRILIVF